MGINVSQATRQARELGEVADRLRALKSKIASEEAELSRIWKSPEFPTVRAAIDYLERELDKIARKLESLESKIIAVAKEIEQEELEQKRREAAAKAKAEAEAKARAKALAEQQCK